MSWLRAFIFNILFYCGTAILAVLLLPSLISPSTTRAAGKFWGWLTCHLLLIVGLTHRNQGDMQLGSQVIYAAKHQSAWETLILYWQLDAPIIVIKHELTRIPILGLFFIRAGCITLDRRAGMSALTMLRRQVLAQIGDGRSVLIFPQGTRTAPSEYAPYQIGVFALYQATSLAVLPIALNSGCFWGRRRFIKRAGQITVSYLPIISPGLSRRPFMARLEALIEDKTAQLEASLK